MRDFSTGRQGYDRVLAAIAATFLIAGVASPLHAESADKTPAELTIDAGVPMPEPANVPPPTAADFKAEAAKTEPATTDATKADAADTNAGKTDAAAAVDVDAAVPLPEPANVPPPTAADFKTDETATPDATAAAAPASESPASATPAVAAADQPVAGRLAELIETRASRYFSRKAERAAVETFYKERGYAPLWSHDGTTSEAAKGVIARMQDAASEGLDPDDYPVPDFAAATTPEALAEAELKLTASVFDYARHAQSGRMHWSRVSSAIQFPEHAPEPTEILASLSGAKDASAALNGYNPQHKAYQALRAKLAELRGSEEDSFKTIPDGATLRYIKPTKSNHAPAMMEDPRVPALRARLHLKQNPHDTRYDADVEAAVRKFQASHGLVADGIVAAKTIRALNTPKTERRIDIVRVNMERWRWLPRTLGAPALGNVYAMLNIPDYTLKVMHNGAPAWKTRVVIGKAGKHATPLLTETMKYITVNPTWNVPPSIVYNEYLPALEQDPTVLDRMGLKFSRRPDGTIHISQPPGAGNALGRIRFNFPNKFLVYQHDTPDKHLFGKEERAFSHGCMRVQNPDQYAATLLGIVLPDANYTPEKIRSMYGQREVNINFPTPVPVHLTYQTAFVDDAGKLEFRKDIYGHDATMIAMLKNGSKDLETVVAHKQQNPVRRTSDITLPGESYASNAPSLTNFFEQLFGGPAVRRPQRELR